MNPANHPDAVVCIDVFYGRIFACVLGLDTDIFYLFNCIVAQCEFGSGDESAVFSVLEFAEVEPGNRWRDLTASFQDVSRRAV